MAKPRRDGAALARSSNGCYSPRQPDRLNHERQTLLDRALDGSNDALGALMISCQPSLKHYFAERLSAKLASKVSPLDLVQESFVNVLSGFAEFIGRSVAEYYKWLMAIGRNVLNALLRRYQAGGDRDLTREELLDGLAQEAACQHAWGRRQPSPEEILAALESSQQLHAALRQLPADQRQIVVWHYLDGLKFIDVAGLLDMSLHAVKRRCKRAIATLTCRLQSASRRF